jgi:methylenetetrahydrofolate reductase (NADPH)
MPDIARLVSHNISLPPKVSFEFFPPQSDEMQRQLWTCIERLGRLNPSFVSVTYGAGGSTRERTHATVERLIRETSLKPAAHLTCVGASKEDIMHVARRYWQAGVRHIVALRGDAPASSGPYKPHPGGFAYADSLVAALKSVADFHVTVAAYPETHPEALSAQFDIDHLKRKVDAGADSVITQYFFDVDMFLRFMDKVRAANITVPVIPGILPVTNVQQMMKFSAMCGTDVPTWIQDIFAGLDDDPTTRQLVAASIAIEQCRLLQRAGYDALHFYTLNRAELVVAICHLLGIRETSGAPDGRSAVA